MLSADVVQKFINFFEACGKTQSILDLAVKTVAENKTCAVVTNWTGRYGKEMLKMPEYKGVVFIDFETVLDEVRQYPNMKGNWRDLPSLKKFDWMVIDPNCYEDIIWSLLKKLEEVKRAVEKVWH